MKAYHDIHIHNYLSKCCGDRTATAESMIEQAKKNGLRLMGFANHIWDENAPFPEDLDPIGTNTKNWYFKQSMAFSMQIKSQIPKDETDIKILVGAETEYCGMYDVLGMSKEGALQLDYLLIPISHVHMHNFTMPEFDEVVRARENLAKLIGERIPELSPERARAFANGLPEAELERFITGDRTDRISYVSDYMVNSFRSLMNNEMLRSYSDLIPVSIAHPFQPVGFGTQRAEMTKLISDETYGELFTIAAKRGIGLEINPWTNNDEEFRMFSIAKECGCKFTLGSDAHDCKGLSAITYAEGLMERLELTEYDMMDFVRI